MESSRRNILAFTPSIIFGSMWLYVLYSMSSYVGRIINSCGDDAACISNQFGGLFIAFAVTMFAFATIGGVGIAVAPSVMYDMITEDVEELPENDYEDENGDA